MYMMQQAGTTRNSLLHHTYCTIPYHTTREGIPLAVYRTFGIRDSLLLCVTLLFFFSFEDTRNVARAA